MIVASPKLMSSYVEKRKMGICPSRAWQEWKIKGRIIGTVTFAMTLIDLSFELHLRVKREAAEWPFAAGAELGTTRQTAICA